MCWDTGFAHSIKNPHIIHAVEQYDYCGETRFGYICNHCFTAEKVATCLEDVTCKNCLKKLGEL